MINSHRTTVCTNHYIYLMVNLSAEPCALPTSCTSRKEKMTRDMTHSCTADDLLYITLKVHKCDGEYILSEIKASWSYQFNIFHGYCSCLYTAFLDSFMITEKHWYLTIWTNVLPHWLSSFKPDLWWFLLWTRNPLVGYSVKTDLY